MPSSKRERKREKERVDGGVIATILPSLRLCPMLVHGRPSRSGNDGGTKPSGSFGRSLAEAAVTREGDQAIRGSCLGRIFSPVPPSFGLSTFFTGSRFYLPAVPRN